jgi:hypothetical protein
LNFLSVFGLSHEILASWRNLSAYALILAARARFDINTEGMPRRSGDFETIYYCPYAVVS